MAIDVINMFLSVFQSAINCLFGLQIQQNVYLGWIFIVVVIMMLLIKFFLKDNGNG